MTFVLVFNFNLLAESLNDFGGADSSQIFNHKPTKEPKTEDLAQFRFKIQLQPYEHVPIHDKKGRRSFKEVALKPITKVLRARVGQTNHFYFGKYHFETAPVSWLADIKRYESSLKVYRRYGPYNEVEEQMTSLNFWGVLSKTSMRSASSTDKIFDIETFATKTHRDKEGRLVLGIKVLSPTGSLYETAPLLSKEMKRQ